MKPLYLLPLLIALVQGAAHEHVPSEEEYEDDCTAMSEDSECANNAGLFGTCKRQCTDPFERIAEAPKLCPGSCQCCTKTNYKCERIFAKGFCSAGECEDGVIEHMFSSLCTKGYVCCREAAKGGGTHREWTEAGERGVGPHFQTFDGVKFTYSGICTYTLVKERADNPSFSVASRHVPASNLHNELKAFHSSLEVKRNENTVILTEGNEKIYFNEQEVQGQLPFESADHSVIIDWIKNQKAVVVALPGVLTLDFNGKGLTMIDLHESKRGKVWGLLGNANGNPADDMTYLMTDDVVRTIELKNPHAFVKEDLQHFFNGWLVTCATR